MATIWYLGPLGAMVAIPAPDDPMDASPNLVGGSHQSLSGVITMDRLSQGRVWAMEWTNLTSDELTYLEAVGRGLVTGPLRLIDPMRRNRLPARIASGGSVSRTASDYTQTGGSTPTWLAVTDPPATAPVRGTISWQRTTTAAASLTTSAATDRVPAIVGEQLVASIWVRGATIQAAAAVDAWDSAGASARTTGTATTLSASTWTQLTVSYTVASGRVAVSPVLVVASGQTASTLQATGWQIAQATEPATWTMGGGSATVVAGELTHSYKLFDAPRHVWHMTMRETAA